MRRLVFSALAVLAALWPLLGASQALAATGNVFPTPTPGQFAVGMVMMCFPNGSSQAVPCSSGTPLNIAGSFSATLNGFQPTPSYAQLAASDTANHSVNVPTGTTDVVYNLDTNVAYCNFGAASTVNTTPVQPGSAVPFYNPSAFATIQCQSPTSSLKITISGGVGLWTGVSGGGGGSGSFPAVVGSNGSTAPTPVQFLTIGGVNGSNVWLPAIMTATQALKVADSDVQSGAGVPNATVFNVQGNASGIPLPTNLTQQAGLALAAPTAPGTPASSGLVPTVNIAGAISATFAPFAPNGNYATLAVGVSSASVALPAGTVVKVDNTGSNAAFVNFGIGSATATAGQNQVAAGGFQCFAVGSNTFIAAIETAGSTSLNLSGGSGGCAGSGGGGSGGGGASPDTPLSLSCTITAANNFSTGLQVADFINGITLTGSPTSGSACSFTGLTGWNSGYLECTGIASNHFEIDKTAGGAVLKRVSVMSGSTYAQSLNLAGATDVTLVADSWTSGSPTCTMRVSVNQALADWSSGPTQPLQGVAINVSTAATTQIAAAVPGQGIYVASWDAIAGGTTNVTWEYGTGSNCGTGTTPLTGAYPLAAQSGVAKNSTGNFFVPPGNALCLVNSAAVQVSGSVSFAYR